VTQATDIIPGGNRTTGAARTAPRAEVRDDTVAGSALRVAAGRADVLALGVFTAFAAIALWLRFVYDNWITEFDLFTMFIPWFGYIGDRIRDGDIPAWSPHYFSGAPTVGNPSGGWMYLLVMLIYPLFHIVTATKVLLLCHVFLSGLATYAFSRRIGLGAAGALTSAMIFALGEIIYGGTNFCTVGGPDLDLADDRAVRRRDGGPRPAAIGDARLVGPDRRRRDSDVRRLAGPGRRLWRDLDRRLDALPDADRSGRVAGEAG